MSCDDDTITLKYRLNNQFKTGLDWNRNHDKWRQMDMVLRRNNTSENRGAGIYCTASQTRESFHLGGNTMLWKHATKKY